MERDKHTLINQVVDARIDARLSAAKTEATMENQAATRTGIRTTEFWVAAALVVVVILRALGVEFGEGEASAVADQIGNAAAGVVAAVYVAGRSFVKRK